MDCRERRTRPWLSAQRCCEFGLPSALSVSGYPVVPARRQRVVGRRDVVRGRIVTAAEPFDPVLPPRFHVTEGSMPFHSRRRRRGRGETGALVIPQRGKRLNQLVVLPPALRDPSLRREPPNEVCEPGSKGLPLGASQIRAQRRPVNRAVKLIHIGRPVVTEQRSKLRQTRRNLLVAMLSPRAVRLRHIGKQATGANPVQLSPVRNPRWLR